MEKTIIDFGIPYRQIRSLYSELAKYNDSVPFFASFYYRQIGESLRLQISAPFKTKSVI